MGDREIKKRNKIPLKHIELKKRVQCVPRENAAFLGHAQRKGNGQKIVRPVGDLDQK